MLENRSKTKEKSQSNHLHDTKKLKLLIHWKEKKWFLFHPTHANGSNQIKNSLLGKEANTSGVKFSASSSRSIYFGLNKQKGNESIIQYFYWPLYYFINHSTISLITKPYHWSLNHFIYHLMILLTTQLFL